jgi:ATP-dependent Lhr-like helicase
MLDDLLASGEVVWMGRGPLGRNDGRVALYLRDQVPLLHWPLGIEIPDGPIHHRLRDHLANRGASFFRDLYVAAEGGDPTDVLDALWDLVWSGEVTNDTLAPLRAAMRGTKRSRGKARAGSLSSSPPAGSGRWYLTADLLVHDVPPASESRAAAVADQLLERHGVVTRDAVLAEGVPGGFAGLYPVFAAMEDAGRTRRGYFVEGLGGAQFGTPGAIDRIRDREEPGVVVLAAGDPANPYGAAVAWPTADGGRPARRAGAHVILHDGRLLAFVERGGKTVVTFPADTADETADHHVAAGLADLADRRYRRMTVETIDGDPVATSRFSEVLLGVGFVAGYKGLTHQSRPRQGAHRARR